MSYTPGPWGLMPGNEFQITAMVGHPDPLYHAEVYGNNLSQLRADARLIAAAPELVEALETALDCLEDGHWSETKANFRALLARIKGES